MPDELRCPSCGLISPPETEYCDCGYDLSGKGPPRLDSIQKALSQIRALLLCIALATVILAAAATLGMATGSPNYEYQIVSPKDAEFSSTMNEIGQDGWELVFARRATGEVGASYEMILKRRL